MTTEEKIEAMAEMQEKLSNQINEAIEIIDNVQKLMNDTISGMKKISEMNEKNKEQDENSPSTD